MAIPDKAGWAEASLARAMYAYLSSGDNQLSFLEGDIIVLLGDRNKGWQFGENLRTQCSGWFPLAYTEVIVEDPTLRNSTTGRTVDTINTNSTAPVTSSSANGTSIPKPSPTTMFGDTLVNRKIAKQSALKTPIVTSLGPPPSLPAPIPELHQRIPRSITTTAMVHPPQGIPMSPRGDAATLPVKRPNGHPPPMPPLPLHLGNKRVNGTPGSLHSSNDSGFSNDPPPQPEVDYSDDDSSRAQQTSLSDVALNAPSDAKKKELLSSVRGWLLYKSALDLWDDVSDQNTLKHPSVSRTHSTRKTNEPNGTLGRYNSNDMLKPTPIAVDKSPPLNNRITVKRTKSLWKFKRSHKNDILEGMSLWKHRSLIDVCKPNGKNGTLSTGDDKQENVYDSAESIAKDKQKNLEKAKNSKNARKSKGKSKSESLDQDDYYSDDTTTVDDGSDSVIVVDDHVNLTLKRKNRAKYEMSSRSDVTQSDTIIGNGNKSEMSNSRSDLSEQTETETIGKESYLPRMKLIKTNSNDLANRFNERDVNNRKGYQTWNPALKVKEAKKWQGDDDKSTNFYRERWNNKLKDTPKLIQDQLRVGADAKAKCGPWYDLWGVDSSVKT
ncbi:hypothetical protein RUM43_004501 [Polyplax serrata]|uniref:SH3 domain-containing protein n=1 Tax=Polyplax serrata TaxID=468196 RepID=A0AAN8XL91_POLSC